MEAGRPRTRVRACPPIGAKDNRVCRRGLLMSKEKRGGGRPTDLKLSSKTRFAVHNPTAL